MPIEISDTEHPLNYIGFRNYKENPRYLCLEKSVRDFVDGIFSGREEVMSCDLMRSPPWRNQEQGFIHPHIDVKYTLDSTFLISPINSASKRSPYYYTCTGIVGIGRSLDSGANVSFLTHQNPDFIFKYEEYWWMFEEMLSQKIRELLSSTEVGSTSFVFFGGNHYNESLYEKSVTQIPEIVRKITGNLPLIVPREQKIKKLEAFLDTRLSRLHFHHKEYFQ